LEQEHYYAIETKDNELKHYGVKGMHWGIRRYQPYTSNPRKDGKGGKFVGNKPKAKLVKDKKGSLGLAVGAAAAGVVGLHLAKAAIRNKIDQHNTKKGMQKAFKKERSRKEAEEAEQRKKDWEEYKKSVKNRDWKDYTEEEKKYTLSEATKKNKMDLAKTKDDYDIDYLEAIQNDWFLSNDYPDAKKTRHSEYKKYLDNPYRYMSTHEYNEDPPSSGDSKSGLAKDFKGYVVGDKSNNPAPEHKGITKWAKADDAVTKISDKYYKKRPEAKDNAHYWELVSRDLRKDNVKLTDSEFKTAKRRRSDSMYFYENMEHLYNYEKKRRQNLPTIYNPKNLKTYKVKRK